MLLKSLKGMVGALNCYTNTYIVYDEKTFEGVLIDIADNVHEIQEYVKKMNINLKYHQEYLNNLVLLLLP